MNNFTMEGCMDRLRRLLEADRAAGCIDTTALVLGVLPRLSTDHELARSDVGVLRESSGALVPDELAAVSARRTLEPYAWSGLTAFLQAFLRDLAVAGECDDNLHVVKMRTSRALEALDDVIMLSGIATDFQRRVEEAFSSDQVVDGEYTHMQDMLRGLVHYDTLEH
jgi:hypothetical protein